MIEQFGPTLLMVLAAAAASWFVAQVIRGYRGAVLEPSRCGKCGRRAPGRFCSRCGYRKF